MENKFHHYVFLLLLYVPLAVSSSYHVRTSNTTFKLPMKPVHRRQPKTVDTSHSSRFPSYIQGNVVGNTGANARPTMLLVEMSIGNPPVQQLLAMDTGAPIMWVQSTSCTKCVSQDGPKYNPSESTTFRNLTCDSHRCPRYDGRVPPCTLSNTCRYYQKYGVGTSSNGTLGTEQLRFETSDEGTTIVSDTIIDCGLENRIELIGGESGNLGLNADYWSLPSQMGSNFSYCIGSLNDHDYRYNQLILGEDAILEGDTTPFEVYSGQQYFTLEGISIAEERLKIDPKIFQRSLSGGGGVIIDTGSTVSCLPQDAYKILRKRARQWMGWLGWLLETWGSDEGLCYLGSVSSKTRGVPVVTLHFVDGAELVLGPDALFWQEGRFSYCMAFRPADRETNVSIVGLYAQQYYNIGYDEGGKRVYIQRIDCQLLED